MDQGARLIIVACNTATARAIDTLRQRYPEVTWVGVEPGVKPAVRHSSNGRIGVLATPSTLSSPRFDSLIDRFAQGCEVIRVPCKGWRRHRGRRPATRPWTPCWTAMRARDPGRADTVVLGCTHYPFVAERIAARLGPQVQLLDTADAVAAHALHLWPNCSGQRSRARPCTRSTGNDRRRHGVGATGPRRPGAGCPGADH
jgi:glutamate racemase